MVGSLRLMNERKRRKKYVNNWNVEFPVKWLGDVDLHHVHVRQLSFVKTQLLGRHVVCNVTWTCHDVGHPIYPGTDSVCTCTAP